MKNSLNQQWDAFQRNVEWMDENLLHRIAEVFASKVFRDSAMATDEEEMGDFCIEVLEGMSEKFMDRIRAEEDLLRVQQVMTGTRLWLQRVASLRPRV